MPDQTGAYREGRQVSYEELRTTLREILCGKSLNYWTGSDLAKAFRQRGYVFSTDRVKVMLTVELMSLISELGLHVGVRIMGTRWDFVVSRAHE